MAFAIGVPLPRGRGSETLFSTRGVCRTSRGALNAILPNLLPLVLTGRPIEIRYRTELRDTAGNPAHAATFIRRRLIVLDAELLEDPSEHGRILLHELFHFLWVRLGNAGRIRWEELMRTELAARARGEAGWSAEWRKRALRAGDVKERTKAWREYCCESFCDTAAWFFGAGEAGGQTEMTLRPRWRRERAVWFSANIEGRELRV